MNPYYIAFDLLFIAFMICGFGFYFYFLFRAIWAFLRRHQARVRRVALGFLELIEGVCLVSLVLIAAVIALFLWSLAEVLAGLLRSLFALFSR